MSHIEKNDTEGVACSIFENEIEKLIRDGKISIPFRYIDSELHMDPQKLKNVLEDQTRNPCVLCYGKCAPNLQTPENENKSTRTEGLNCIEIILGKEHYRKLRKQGVFFLLPEWTCKWERIFKELLGFSDQELAIEFMNDMHNSMLYIDTGVIPVPEKELREIYEYFKIPVNTLHVKLDHLAHTINKASKTKKKS